MRGRIPTAPVYIGGISAAAGAVTVGAWYLFLLSLDRFLYPIMSISSFWTNVQNGLSAAERVFALIDAEPAVVQTGRQDVPALRGEVQFKELSFRYKSGESVLEAFNLHIRAGESLALVGHTGAGKTSVARLIARFYEYQEAGCTSTGTISVPSTWSSIAASWGSFRRCRSSFPAACWKTSVMPARM